MPPEPHRPHRLMGNLHSIPQTSGQPSITTFQPLFFSLDSDDTFTIAAAPTTAVPETTERLTQYSTAPIRQSRRCRCRCHVSPPPRTQHVKLEPHVHRLPWSCPVPTQCPPSCGGCLSRGTFHPKVQRDLDSLSLPTLASLANSSISVQSSPNHEMHPSLPRTLLVSSPSQRRALMPPPPVAPLEFRPVRNIVVPRLDMPGSTCQSCARGMRAALQAGMSLTTVRAREDRGRGVMPVSTNQDGKGDGRCIPHCLRRGNGVVCAATSASVA